MGGQPDGMRRVYDAALVDCELPTPRERAALLTMMLDFIPSTTGRVALYRAMVDDMGAADILYRGILARVTTPAQVRELSLALGLVTVEPSVLEKAIKDAKTPAEKVTALRGLFAQFPNDLALALLVLDALEDASDAAGARLFADTLRARPDADTRVRTAIGELYLRLAAVDTDAEEKRRDGEEARRTFGEIVEFAPNDPVARRRLGDLFRAHGFYEDASRQYETLGKLLPDDPAVPLLLAACANGLGKLEEAVRWTEKGGSAGAPDASQGPYATARAFAVTYLAWGKLEARGAKDTPTLDALTTRLTKVLAAGGSKAGKGQLRVVLTWSHPEFHPALWSNALGPTMPAPEGDATLGISQAILPARADAAVEVRIEPQDLERAARLGAKATLTVIAEENGANEIVAKSDVGFSKGGASTLHFRVANGTITEEPSK
ncbi:MAG: tetratricopeptide repeat protein [Polyangiaceae bacterium]